MVSGLTVPADISDQRTCQTDGDHSGHLFRDRWDRGSIKAGEGHDVGLNRVERKAVSDFPTPPRSLSCCSCQVRGISFERLTRHWQTVGPVSGTFNLC